MNGIKIKGAEKLIQKLRNMERGGAKRALRKATRAGSTVLGKAVRQEVPIDEGVLKRAETTKITNKGLTASGMAGADVDKMKADERRPSNIDWLVEFGHVAPDGTVIPPSGFTRRAGASAMPRAEQAFTRKLAEEIEREATR